MVSTVARLAAQRCGGIYSRGDFSVFSTCLRIFYPWQVTRTLNCSWVLGLGLIRVSAYYDVSATLVVLLPVTPDPQMPKCVSPFKSLHFWHPNVCFCVTTLFMCTAVWRHVCTVPAFFKVLLFFKAFQSGFMKRVRLTFRPSKRRHFSLPSWTWRRAIQGQQRHLAPSWERKLNLTINAIACSDSRRDSLASCVLG